VVKLDAMNEEVSALMDGQLGDEHAAGCTKRIRENPQMRAAWNTYHLIGDTLRGQDALALPREFDGRLQAEPTVLAPRRRVLGHASPRTRFALSAAAGIAAIGFVGWMSYPFLNTAPSTLVQNPIINQANADTQATVGVMPVAENFDDYQMAHRPYSPGFGMNRVAPYARNVSAADGQR
jgi:sigma-E factor negative regulatory protein RseA